MKTIGKVEKEAIKKGGEHSRKGKEGRKDRM
jgi:hypothetical protein